MKICILTPRFPFPENGGDVLRINAIARYLKEKGSQLCLCSYTEGKVTDENLIKAKCLYDNIYYIKRNKLASLFYSFISLLSGKPVQCGYYYSIRYKKLFSKVCLVEKPDLYISHLLRMTPYLVNEQCRKKTIIEMTDALSKTYTLSSNIRGFSPKKWIYKIEKRRMEKYEQKVIAEYPKVVLVSKSDKVLLGNQKNIFVHTNGVNCISQLNDNYNPDKITFVGNMRTLQNQDAVLFFAKEIFPLVKEKKPDAFFEIIGAQPSEQIKELHDGKNIIVTGYVDSVEDELKDSCVAVAPVRIAAGIQNKVLVAMACGVPVVLTSLISQAIPELSDGINCFVQDSKEKIAEKIIDLMTDNNLRKLVARKGFEIVQENYSWNSKLDGYEILVQEQKN